MLVIHGEERHLAHVQRLREAELTGDGLLQSSEFQSSKALRVQVGHLLLARFTEKISNQEQKKLKSVRLGSTGAVEDTVDNSGALH